MEDIKKFDDFLNEELSKLQIEYREFFKYMLSQYGVSSPSQLSPDKKAEFFAEIKKNWQKGVGLKVKNFIKTNEAYVPDDPVGKRVKLVKMNDPYTKLKPGDAGVVQSVDGTGTLHTKWDNGSTLGLIPEIDTYEFIAELDEPEDVYQSSLKDEYWKQLKDKFPEYNTSQAKEASKWILEEMKKKYPTAHWDKISDKVQTKIFDGIT